MYQKTTFFNLRKSSLNMTAVVALLASGTSMFAQPYINGGISTGAISKSGVAAPAGYTWSELQNNAGDLTTSNSTTGVGTQMVATTTNRVADNFTVPAGQQWTLSKATFYAYQTNYAGTTSPFTDVRVRISNGNPSLGGSTVVFGDLTTNRLLATSDAMMYRIANSVAPAPGTVPATNRQIWNIEATVNAVLPAGTYWIEWTLGAGTGGNFSPPSTIVDARTQPGYNAVQYQSANATWVTLLDQGNPADAPDVAVDMPFRLDYALTLDTDDKTFAEKVLVYPNPASNILTIAVSEGADSAQIHDIAGRLVMDVLLGDTVNNLNIADLSAGSYIVTISSGQQKVAKKFIKE